MQEVKQSDWKLFRERFPKWQEQHMETLIQGYMAIFQEDKNPALRFWEVYDLMKNDVHHPGVVAEMARSQMTYNIVSVLDAGTITMDDLEGFSDEVKDEVAILLRWREESRVNAKKGRKRR